MKRITKAEAIELNQNFIKIKGKVLDKVVEKQNNKPKEKDAISSWFSIDELKNFIEDCENSDHVVNGFRIYFGSYGNKDKVNKNLSTVFVVPTKARVGALQKDGLDSKIDGGIDITELGGLNNGSTGNPPSSEYPQLN